MRDDLERLNDIREAIERIERHQPRDRDAFIRDELVQTWIVHHLEIIGEAARGLSEEFRFRHSQVPWSRIIGMRNILVHHYFNLDSVLIWSVVEREGTIEQLALDEGGV